MIGNPLQINEYVFENLIANLHSRYMSHENQFITVGGVSAMNKMKQSV